MPDDERERRGEGKGPPGRAGGSERRQHPRHPVAGVSGTFLFSTEGKILNLSLDGMAVETSDYLQVGRTYSLKLAQAGEELLLMGKVVWCRMVRTDRSLGDIKPIYAAGVRFEELLSHTARQLHQFLGANAVVSLDKRVFGRFRLHGSDNANLELHASFQVEKISLSGLEIRSDTLAEPESILDLEIRVGNRTLSMQGRVVNSRRLPPGSRQGLVAQIGIAFLNLNDSTLDAIRDLIRTAIH